MLVVAALWNSALAQGNSSIGAWKLNIAKSTFSPGPPPKSQTLKIVAFGLGVTTTVDVVTADGETQHWTYTAGYDERDVRITGNNPNGDAAARKRISSTTTVTTIKRAGKVTLVNTGVVSADGKTYTVTSKGTDVQGRSVSNVLVFDKQ
jgi:hypothetical protein